MSMAQVDKLVESLSKIFSNTPINEVMTAPPIVVNPNTKVKYVKDIMRIKRISGMPVISKSLKLIGIISIEDIIRVFEGGQFEDTVEKWMTPNPVFVYDDTTLYAFLEQHKALKYGRYPVVNKDMKVVGVITKMDVLEWLLTKLGYIYVHDTIRNDILEKHDLEKENFLSSLTEDNTDKNDVDFKYEINYNSVEMVGIGATKLKKFLSSKEVNEQIIRKISIATYEAEANVVIHSGTTGTIYCWIKDDHIRILIEDLGRGIEDIDLAMKEGYSTAPETIREKGFGAGMGLPNMKRFSDKMTVISSAGKGVKVEMLYYTNK